jgi:hypothetical protein
VRAVLRLLVAGVLALGCRPKASPPLQGGVSELPPTPPQAPAGSLRGGRFEDMDGIFAMALPDGWRVRPGWAADALRLSLEDPSTGAQITVYRYVGEDLQPRPREGCDWRFQDQGPYTTLRTSGPVGAAACLTLESDARKRVAWLTARSGYSWQLELSCPVVGLLPAWHAGVEALGAARWQARP